MLERDIPQHDLIIRELAERSGAELVWASLGAIRHSRLFRAVGALIMSLHDFTRPAPAPVRADVTTGALEITPVATRGVMIASNCTKLAWADVHERSVKVMEECRAELRRMIRDPDTPPDMREQLNMWLDCCKTPDLGDITPALQESCYEADDPRLATLPFAAFAVPVRSEHMAPLPPPPDQSCIPEWALDWDNVIKPWFYDKTLTTLIDLRTRLNYALTHDTFVGAPRVEFLAFGCNGCMDWAARLLERGNTLIRVDGRIRLKDCSHAPATHWHRDAMGRALARSHDHGLRDAVLTHGISYLADLQPILMISDHLQSLAEGMVSVHKELARLADKGWYSVLNMTRLDEGKIDLGCLPMRCVSHGSVSRRLEPNRRRRVVDNRQPRRVRYLLGTKTRVSSLADACGWDESKRIRKALLGDDAYPQWLRHSPAFRREQLAVTLGKMPEDPVATSKTPSQVYAMEMAQHGDAARAQAAVDSHNLRPRHPAQKVPLFCDLLLDMCIMAHTAFLLNEVLLGFGDDEADSFHQFMNLLEQIWQCGILLLDPHEVIRLAESGDAPGLVALASVMEGCMSMGTPPASGYCQRLNTELGEAYEEDVHASEERFIKLLAACNAQFANLVAVRNELTLRTGRPQLRLVKISFFADDPIILCAGGPTHAVSGRPAMGMLLWSTGHQHAHGQAGETRDWCSSRLGRRSRLLAGPAWLHVGGKAASYAARV